MDNFKKFLDKPTYDLETLSKRHGVSLDFLKQQLVDGIAVEKEHTNHLKVAREIALDHLGEDPNYYVKLKDVES